MIYDCFSQITPAEILDLKKGKIFIQSIKVITQL